MLKVIDVSQSLLIQGRFQRIFYKLFCIGKSFYMSQSLLIQGRFQLSGSKGNKGFA